MLSGTARSSRRPVNSVSSSFGLGNHFITPPHIAPSHHHKLHTLIAGELGGVAAPQLLQMGGWSG